MKDYSDWEPIYDYENESPYVNPNRAWLKYRTPLVPRSIRFDPIPVHEFIKVQIRNFRSIIDTNWTRLAPDNITALIGQNESGKTS